VDAIADRVTRRPDARLVSPPAQRQEPGGGYAARFLDNDGRVIEVSAGLEARSLQPAAVTESRPSAVEFGPQDFL
jgi:hypothetical protein